MSGIPSRVITPMAHSQYMDFAEKGSINNFNYSYNKFHGQVHFDRGHCTAQWPCIQIHKVGLAVASHADILLARHAIFQKIA